MAAVRSALTDGVTWVAIVVAALGIAVAGAVATGSPQLAEFITAGIALGTKVVGFLVAIGGLVKTGQTLTNNDMSFLGTGGAGFTALAGAALVFVGTLAGG